MRVSLVVLLLMGVVAMGEPTRRRALHQLPYGDAGCGWGSLVMGQDDQILAATTNQFMGNQTFAMSSGTSNCVDVETDEVVGDFIEFNRPRLESELVRGEGELLSTLEHLMGCPKDSVSPQWKGTAGLTHREFRQALLESIHLSGVSCTYF